MTAKPAAILSSPDPAWSPLQRWAFAIGAPYNVQNQMPVDGLPRLNAELHRDITEKLKQYWSLESGEDLVKTLDWLATEGHRRSNRERIRRYCLIRRPAVAAKREELRPDQFDTADERAQAAAELWRLDAVQANWNNIRGAPLLGFDATRAAMLVRDGLLLDWLPADWAWRYLTDLAADIHRSFTSWADLAADFKVSRALWRGSPAPDQFDAITDRLLTAPESPWRRLPWPTPGFEIPRPIDPQGEDAPIWSLER